MSGRAGRRGLDDKGIVILTVDQKMNPGTAKNIVKVHSFILLSFMWLYLKHRSSLCVGPAGPRSVLCVGPAGPTEQRLPPDVQHGAEPAARRRDKPRVHAGAILPPVPELLRHPQPHRQYVTYSYSRLVYYYVCVYGESNLQRTEYDTRMI